MNTTTAWTAFGRRAGGTALLALAATAAQAQAQSATADPSTTGTGAPAAPSPWYLGVSQGITHSSNVYRVPSGSGDTWSTTSLFGGFDQRIGRQRVFGSAEVDLNRYFDENRLDNTSYSLATGLDWETVGRLSGSVDAGLDQSLVPPPVVAGAPTERRNLGRTQTFGTRVRWGGTSLLTLEAGYDHARLDYSSPDYVSAETRRDSGSLALYYRPSGALRLGVGVHADRTRTPKALLDDDGGYEGNTVRGRYLDLYADYSVASALSVDARLTYARQRNSTLERADFTGPTGRVGATWQPGGRLTLTASVARDAGFDIATRTGSSTTTAGGSSSLPLAAYENNRVTWSADVGASYRVTAKTTASAGARYSRARLVTTGGSTEAVDALPDSTDRGTSVYLGASYEIRRNWTAGCNVSHDTRKVSGGVDYDYRVNTVGCSTRLLWR